MEAVLEGRLGSGSRGQAIVGDLSEAYHRLRDGRPGWWCDGWYAWQAATLLVRRTGRSAPPGRGLGGFATDLRWAARVALRRPLMAGGIVLTLGLGLGVNTAVFSVIDGTLSATSWWQEPERTLVLWPGHTFSRGLISIFQENAPAFEALGAYRLETYAVDAGDGRGESVAGAVLSPELFGRLRVRPVLGRGFAPDDALPGGEPTVVVSHAFWSRALGGDPAAVGRRLLVNGTPHTVVGVQGPGGTAPGPDTELWLPLVLDPRDPDFFPAIDLTAVGFLRPGADALDGQSDLRAFGRHMVGLFPFFFRPDYLQDGTVVVARDHEQALLRTPLLLLLGGTAALLLVASLNVGNMLLARASERRRELALRRALGADRFQVVRQLGAESALLALVGTGLAAAVVGPAGAALAGLFPADVAVVRSGLTSPGVLAFAAGTTLLAWLVLSGVPIAAFLSGERRGLRADLTGKGRSRGLLVGTQSALATVLLVAGLLLTSSIANLRRIPLGFEPGGVTAAALSPPANLLGEGRLRAFQEDAVRAAGALGGVTAAGMGSVLPLDRPAPTTPVRREDRPTEVGDALQALRFAVDPGWFEVLGVELLNGRLLDLTESARSPSAAVVNRALAEALWPGEEAVGRRIAIDPHAWDAFIPVVGVVEDVRTESLVDPPRPTLYLSLRERPERETALVVKSVTGRSVPPAALRGAVAEADPGVPVGAVRPLDSVVRDAYGTAWVTMGLITALAALATALAALGIHAALAYHVERRRREIGVRLALGAERGRLVAGVLGTGLAAAATGVGVGCLLAASGGRVLGALLYDVSALAPWAYAATAAAVLGTATLAAWLPAARAGRLAPADVLREE